MGKNINNGKCVFYKRNGKWITMRGGNTDPIRARRCVYKKNITKWIKIGRTQKHRSCTSEEMCFKKEISQNG